MSEESIENRLKETSQTCLDAYLTWDKDKKDAKSVEALHSAVHELRKVASRLEIELAASDRDNGGHKKIHTPSHKSKHSVAETSDAPKIAKTRQRRPRKPKTEES